MVGVSTTVDGPGPLHRQIDLAGAQEAARALLIALGTDVEDESVADTPRRMAVAYAELMIYF